MVLMYVFFVCLFFCFFCFFFCLFSILKHNDSFCISRGMAEVFGEKLIGTYTKNQKHKMKEKLVQWRAKEHRINIWVSAITGTAL